MNEIFYIDLYFATNFLMDLVSLALGALSASHKVPLWRMSLAALFGAGASTALALVRWSQLAKLVLSLPVFAAMIGICFGLRRPRTWLKPALFSFAGAVFLGGAAHMIFDYVSTSGGAAHPGFGVFLGAVALGVFLYSLWGKHINCKLDTAVVSLSISFCGRCEHFYGLVDSGLLLRDPDLGRPVLLLKAEFASPLLPRDFIWRMARGELSGEEKLICVPIRSVGGERELYAFLPERVQVCSCGKRKMKKEERDVLVALDFTQGGYGGCPCLVPLSVL
ncbi:MAG: sigma-E processing peptidase SpoIIGA [Clostridia bacterium]|nr:sigma-E processing peptidase SpoIIGA [Clostridia bacterium]